MKIMQKIEDVRQQILDGDTTLAEDLATQGIEAIFEGIKSPKWEALMGNFANNQNELDRLCGRDQVFNKSRWGLACLAYIAGNSTCTATTATDGGTARGMTPAMKLNLDAESQPLALFKDDQTDSSFTASSIAPNTDSAPAGASNGESK
jgi:hypothetical protein